MKKSYYCDNYNQSPTTTNQNGYSNADNEKRKILSLETNRRRRDMAVRVKMQIEKEEERRRQILRERREYHDNMSTKMRKPHRNKSARQPTSPSKHWDFDQTLNMIRNNSSNSTIGNMGERDNSNWSYKTVLEGAWGDGREGCPSPMAKYSGTNLTNKQRTSDFYLKTFETKLMAQEQSFKQKQNFDMSEFSRILDETIDGAVKPNSHINFEEGDTYRVDSNSKSISEYEQPPINYNGIIEEVLNDSLDNSSDENMNTDIIDCNKNSTTSDTQKEKFDVKVTELEDTHNGGPSLNSSTIAILNKNSAISQNSMNQNNCSTLKFTPIKSILKKDPNSKFDSNPDLSGIMLRDSVEVTRIKSARIKRSSSFSQGINYTDSRTICDDRNSTDDDSSRKFVRFADDATDLRRENISIVNLGPDSIPVSQRVSDSSKATMNLKVHKTPAVPNSTPLKPPLHPRSIQEGSYLQATLKKTSVFHPPPKPRKISAEILDQEVGSIINHKRPVKSHSNLLNTTDIGQPSESNVPLDKTPTEREIDLLWAEVRECLSKSQKPSKTGSVGTPAGISVRTVDSGSESSVWSAPTWQRNTKKTPSFQVRHNGQITPKQSIYQGQEPPIKDLVIVHAPHEPYIHSGVVQQPLSVLSREDHVFQEVSESLKEFLATENACHIPQSPKNVFLPHPPASLNRPRFRPPIKYKLFVPAAGHNAVNSQPLLSSECNPHQSKQIDGRSNSHTLKTQLSMDEEKVKMSLDRLNERLKSVANIL